MTQEALKESIEVWKLKLVEDHPKWISLRTDVCPLCELYYYIGCKGCPIFKSTGQIYCRNTPHGGAYQTLKLWIYDKLNDYDETESRTAFRRAARKMIEFMQSLVEAK